MINTTCFVQKRPHRPRGLVGSQLKTHAQQHDRDWSLPLQSLCAGLWLLSTRITGSYSLFNMAEAGVWDATQGNPSSFGGSAGLHT